jgi:hypothetical protein
MAENHEGTVLRQTCEPACEAGTAAELATERFRVRGQAGEGLIQSAAMATEIEEQPIAGLASTFPSGNRLAASIKAPWRPMKALRDRGARNCSSSPAHHAG